MSSGGWFLGGYAICGVQTFVTLALVSRSRRRAR